MDTRRTGPTSDLLSALDYQKLFASTSKGFLCLDEAGRILDINPFLCSLLGCTAQDLKGKSFWNLAGLSVPARTGHRQDLASRQNMHALLKGTNGLQKNFAYRHLGWLSTEEELIECTLMTNTTHPPSSEPPVISNSSAHKHFLNPDQIEESAKAEIEYTRTHHQPLSLMSISIDQGKRVSTESDSSTIEAAFHRLSTACSNVLRATDIAGKVDDTTIVVLMPGTLSKGALRAADRLRAAISDLDTTQDSRLRRLTVSIGIVATRTGRTTYATLRSRADAKRDDAHSDGGNRINL